MDDGGVPSATKCIPVQGAGQAVKGSKPRMNQSEILALMRQDLLAVGIEPDRYFGPNVLIVPLSFTKIRIGPTDFHGKLLADWLYKCHYRPELISRLYKYALSTGQDRATLGDIVMFQIKYQVSTRTLSFDGFFKWLLEAKSARGFMTRLLTY